MKIKQKAPVEKPVITLLKLSNHTLIESLTVCQLALGQILQKILKQLPPDPEILLQYSSLLIKKTTQKLVDVTMLESEIMPCDFQSDSQAESDCDYKNELEEPFGSQYSKQKKSQIQNRNIKNSIKIKTYPQKSLFKPFKITKSHKLKEDEEIHIKKDGIKLIKKDELNNVMQHRISDSRSSLHLGSNKMFTCQQDISSKNIFNKVINFAAKDMIGEENLNSINLDSKVKTDKQSHQIVNKSAKSLSSLPEIEKGNQLPRKISRNKERISGLINQSQFINLKDYYQDKENKIPNIIKKTSSSMFINPDKNMKSPQNCSEAFKQNPVIEESSWLNQKQNQKPDEVDAMINKLRERKEKFCRTGINYSNGESHLISKRQKNMTINQNQKGSQNNQLGTMIAFDYSGQILSTFKYDTLKMQSHYQDMQFAVNQNDESLAKKKERKGHMFRGAINLKLVDHQKFIPHPQYKHEPLIEKSGLLMKESISYSLKRGVQFKPKEENQTQNGQNSPIDFEQTRQKINRGAFQFLYNDELQVSKVKYQDFIRFKSSAYSVTSLHRNPSVKKIFDQKEEQNLSKNSIVFKGLRGKLSNQQDANNKVYKSENRKALEMLISSVQLTCHDSSQTKDQINETQNFDSPKVNGALKKNGLEGHTKPSVNNQIKLVKKKVRIA